MLPYRRVAGIECVEHPDGVRLAGKLSYFVGGGPLEVGDLAVGDELAAEDLAPEDEGDDAAVHVLVDAGQRLGHDRQAGLLLDLAAERGGDGLPQFQDAARRFPVLVVAPAD